MTQLTPDKQPSYPAELQQDAWQKLKQFTDARIALGRAGCSIPTQPLLEFQLAHAQARDAVFHPLDSEHLGQLLAAQQLHSIAVHSQAQDKQTYLKRPDLGRLLSSESSQLLHAYQRAHPAHYDVAIVIGDGLSARAIEENALAMTKSLQALFAQESWSLAPIIIATGSRVALGDQVAEILNASMLIMMIGERPGLSSPDSMGIYYTLAAKTGTLDSSRNCISNIRAAGLSVPVASQRLLGLMRNSKRTGISGVNLKDDQRMESIGKDLNTKLLF